MPIVFNDRANTICTVYPISASFIEYEALRVLVYECIAIFKVGDNSINIDLREALLWYLMFYKMLRRWRRNKLTIPCQRKLLMS